jgi:hypothetical protein
MRRIFERVPYALQVWLSFLVGKPTILGPIFLQRLFFKVVGSYGLLLCCVTVERLDVVVTPCES